MKMSIDGLVMLAGLEGLVVNRYLDTATPPVWTIGVGHTASAGGLDPRFFTGTLTIQQAIDLFQTDIAKYERGVNAALKVPVAQHEFDALVSFHYNTGAIGRASFMDKLNAGDRKWAAVGMMDWNKPPSIVGRRTKERDLFLTGRYSGDGVVVVYLASPIGQVLWNKGRSVDVKALLRMGQVDAPPAVVAPVAPPAPVVKRSLWDRLRGLVS